MLTVFREQRGGQPTYWPCGVRRIGGMTCVWAFVRNLRTGLGDAKGEGTSGGPTRRKSTEAPARGALLRSSEEAGNFRGAKEAGHPRQVGVNGQPEELRVLMAGGSLPWVARAG